MLADLPCIAHHGFSPLLDPILQLLGIEVLERFHTWVNRYLHEGEAPLPTPSFWGVVIVVIMDTGAFPVPQMSVFFKSERFAHRGFLHLVQHF